MRRLWLLIILSCCLASQLQAQNQNATRGLSLQISHSTLLKWTASVSVVAGYVVYRGTVSGGPYVRIGTTGSVVQYNDVGVTGGQTFYYVVTAKDAAGTESIFSNQVIAVIPP